MDKKYWKSLEELNSLPEKDYLEDYENLNRNEMLDLVQGSSSGISSNRRDFLKLCGFSIASTALITACERPVQKAIPYFFKPEEVIPGMASYYATTFYDGDEYGSILVKVRDGRPIKIEGNALSELSGGRATARIQASILELYDSARFRAPLENGNETSWEETDKAIIQALDTITGASGKIVVLTGTVISPSTRQIINTFLDQHPLSEWIQYDPISVSAILEANRLGFNRRVIPSLFFDRAQLIISFGADFLGTWIMPGTFAGQYARGRGVSEEQPSMSKHIQFESSLSLTGANADERYQIMPSEVTAVLTYLYEKLRGNNPPSIPGLEKEIEELASELGRMAGRSLIVCGHNDLRAQLLVNSINSLLGNYGSTIDINTPINIRQGDDQGMASLIGQMNRGEVDGIIIHDVNPVFDHPRGADFAEGMERVPLKISLAPARDETSALCNFICPDNHYLESWGDAEPVRGQFSLRQPVIRRLGNTRQMQESLMQWAGMDGDYHSMLKEFWETSILAGQDWNETLQKGVHTSWQPQPSHPVFNPEVLNQAGPSFIRTGEDVPELEIIQSVALGSGRHANNPWLQELPDPLSKVCWDNYLAVSVADAGLRNLSTGDIVRLDGNLEIPVVVQPGQMPGTMSAFMGYGRTIGGKVAPGVGVNVLPLAGFFNGSVEYRTAISSLEKTSRKHRIARSQTHHSMEGRNIFRETTVDRYRENPAAGNEVRQEILDHMYTLYPPVVYDGLHWAMAIDLNKCTGCSACVVACQVENNIPVIGRDEIYRRRIMHWIRIDRYFSGDTDNPSVHFMPVTCQHCDNAPCENVCPVAATNHSVEGLNQMSYVRCIGTKYCINNCPYKVRRFNWFNYTRSDEFNHYMNDETGRMVLNPDVTVRERGIVEKCTFCVQRIQEAKNRAKAENRMLRQDEVIPACAQTCPSNAIVFGNIADRESEVYKLFSDKRNYHLLEELHTLPTVGYLTKVKNKQS